MSERRKYVLDSIDLKLISVLKENSRISFAKLAEALGLSESAVRKRVNKLRNMGIIKKFTIEYELINEVKAVILVKTVPPRPVPEISNEIIKIEGVEAVYEVTGDNDILVMVRVGSVDEVNRCIDEIRSIKGVTSTNTMIILRVWSK